MVAASFEAGCLPDCQSVSQAGGHGGAAAAASGLSQPKLAVAQQGSAVAQAMQCPMGPMANQQ
jgi:hypothetical protein